jgi:thioredoxin 1
MNQPTPPKQVSPPWLLIAGLLLGGGLLVVIAWDSIASSFRRSPAKGPVVTLTTTNWKMEVVDSKVPVVVDFWAKWCGPCLDFAPTIDKLAGKYEGRVKVGKLNVDDAPEISEKYKIRGIPCVMIFNGGAEPVTSFTGANTTEAELAAAIDRVLKTPRTE